MTRRFLAACAATMIMAAGLVTAQTAPKSVIHVITIQWTQSATPAQIDGALKAAHALPKAYPGITRVWTKAIKQQLQDGFTHIIVMEFASEDALAKYADSPAQKKWYEAYLPIRQESRTHDITN
jgi:antibiotic biosynthesis monooxygenase (ABM) superfamily enzyme